MLTGGIIGFFKALINGVVKVAAWLLFALGLWLPSLYFIVFLIVCACTGTSLSDVMQTFIVGMIFSAAVGVVLSYYIEKHKRKERQVVRKTLREEKRERKLAEKKARQSEKNGQNESTDETAGQSRNVGTSESAGLNESFAVGAVYLPVTETPEKEKHIEAAERKEPKSAGEGEPRKKYFDADESELRRKYFDAESATSYKDYKYDYESAAQKRLKAINEREERPLVFRSRRDENLFIYEYEDRLQIYRRTKGGDMILTDVIERRRK